MSKDVFHDYSAYYDLLYRDKDYPAEVDYITRTLRASDLDTRTLLELGSGTGRHGSLLAKRGFDVFGVECSPSMLKVSRSFHAHSVDGSFSCVEGDVRTVELARVFDSVLALFHVVSYQTTNDDVMKTFFNTARHLRPKGVFLFDVWHGPAVLHERPSIRVKRVEDESTRLTRIAEPELDTSANVVKVRYTMMVESKTDRRLTTFHEEHRMRYFFPTEIGLLADRVGFEVERSEEFLTGRIPSEKTWGVAYVLRKRC
jgi:SAM-dependent methyltransferase